MKEFMGFLGTASQAKPLHSLRSRDSFGLSPRCFESLQRSMTCMDAVGPLAGTTKGGKHLDEKRRQTTESTWTMANDTEESVMLYCTMWCMC